LTFFDLAPTFKPLQNYNLKGRNSMRSQRLLVLALALSLLLLGSSVYAQVNRPYRNGSVWSVSFIRMNPGMESAYLNYIASDWKKEQEASKTAGLSLSYKVLQTEAHSPQDWNLILMTEFKDLATLEANEKKADALAQRVIGNDDQQRQGYKQRSEIREVMGTRLAREVVLEPRP
jgi:hypothetical protein